MKNDIRNLYWPGLYNVKFVHNCSGSMLLATSRSDKYTNFRAGCQCHAHRKLYCCQKYCCHSSNVSTLTLGNNFSVVLIESLGNFKHFHVSAM